MGDNSIPDHIVRYPTRAAIDRLVVFFDLRNEPNMQDWEIEVADSARCVEFLAGYENFSLDADERFTFMWTILQSFDESEIDLAASLDWQKVLWLIESEIELHIYTVWHWSALRINSIDYAWRVTPFMREILVRHCERFDATA
ncbi:MAG: hypothetical protein AAF351_07545 [Pseudomonadota bacterium]